MQKHVTLNITYVRLLTMQSSRDQTRFDREMMIDSVLGRLSREWYTSSRSDFLSSIRRQCVGLRYCLVALLSAVDQEYNQYNLNKLFDHVGKGHTALNRFCDVAINLRHKFPETSLHHTQLYQRVNLYAIDLRYLMFQFNQVIHYFLHNRVLLVLYLRIIYKLRTKIESYLVHVDYWNSN